jgi:hypothetical protein
LSARNRSSIWFGSAPIPFDYLRVSPDFARQFAPHESEMTDFERLDIVAVQMCIHQHGFPGAGNGARKDEHGISAF